MLFLVCTIFSLGFNKFWSYGYIAQRQSGRLLTCRSRVQVPICPLKYSMFSITLVLPLISALTIGLFGSYIGTFGSLFFSCMNLILALVMSLVSFWSVSHEVSLYVDL